MRRLLLPALLAILAAASSSADPPEPRAPRPGERLEFRVALGPLPDVARVRVETLPPIPAEDGDHLRILADVTPGPLMAPLYDFHYHLVSTVSLPGLLPLRSSRQMEEGEIRVFAALTFDHPGGRVVEAARAGGEPLRSDPIHDDTRDLLAAMYHARTLSPDAESRFSVFEDGRLYGVRVEPAGAATVEVPLGEFRADRFRVEAATRGGERPLRELEVWIGPAPRRLPLRLRAVTPLGTMVAELARADSP